MDYPTILRVTSDFRQEWYEKLEKEVSVLTAEKLYQYFMLRKRDPYLEESLRQEFCSVTTVSGSAWRKNRRRSRIKPAPGAAGESADGQ